MKCPCCIVSRFSRKTSYILILKHLCWTQNYRFSVWIENYLVLTCLLFHCSLVLIFIHLVKVSIVFLFFYFLFGWFFRSPYLVIELKILLRKPLTSRYRRCDNKDDNGSNDCYYDEANKD